MWIFTQNGFISAVDKGGAIQLRARDRESLQLLGFEKSRIITGQGTDYPFRAMSTRDELKQILAAQVDAINYSNFKDQVKKVRGQRYASALMDVWTAMLRVEPKNVTQLLGKSSWRLPRRSTKYDPHSRYWDRDAYFLDRDLPEVPDLDVIAPDDLGEMLLDSSDLELAGMSIHDMTDEQFERWVNGD